MKIPDVMEKREWIYGDKTSEQLTSLGEAYLQKKLYTDACACFLGSNYKKGLEELRDIAVELGDAFLAGQTEQMTKELWQKLGENAEKMEKWVCARTAFEKVGNEEKATTLKQKIKEKNQGKYFEKL